MRCPDIDDELRGSDGNHDQKPKLPNRWSSGTSFRVSTTTTNRPSVQQQQHPSSSSVLSSRPRSRASFRSSSKLDEDVDMGVGPFLMLSLENQKKDVDDVATTTKTTTETAVAKSSYEQSFNSFRSGDFNPFDSINWEADDFAAFTDFMQTEPAFIKADIFHSGYSSNSTRSKQNCRQPRRQPWAAERDPTELADTVRRKGIVDAVIDSKVMLEESNEEENDEVVSLGHSPPSSSCLKSKDKKTKKKRHVAFGGVRVHTHALELGDNPSVKTGVPLTLGWDVLKSQEFVLEDFEAKGHKSVKVYSARKREKIAKESGVSNGTILRAYQEVANIKLDREASMNDPEMRIESEPREMEKEPPREMEKEPRKRRGRRPSFGKKFCFSQNKGYIQIES